VIETCTVESVAREARPTVTRDIIDSRVFTASVDVTRTTHADTAYWLTGVTQRALVYFAHTLVHFYTTHHTYRH